MRLSRVISRAIPPVQASGWQLGLMLLVALVLLSACAAVQPRRDNPEPCGAGDRCHDAMIEHAPNYRLGYVQFGDDGRYVETRQIENVLSDIAEVADDGLILVAFSHGWKENSAANRWSVTGFKSMLSAIAAREQQLAYAESRTPRRVAGVFLGWPGHISTLPGLNGLTWFDREDAAVRIARGDLSDALLKLKAMRDSQSGNRLILVGHSLGATMLYQRLANEPLRSPGTVLTPIADLVLLLSPAIAASDAYRLENLNAADRSVLPPILAITSEADATLRLAFPLAQWLGGPADANGQSDVAGYQAMGTHGPLVTHHLVMEGAQFALKPTTENADETALLQVAAAAEIMRGHKDIANPRLVNFIAEVAALLNNDRLSRAALAQAFPGAAPIR